MCNMYDIFINIIQSFEANSGEEAGDEVKVGEGKMITKMIVEGKEETNGSIGRWARDHYSSH